MQENSALGVVIPFPFNLRKRAPKKNELLENEDVERFFRFVIENELRVEALEALEARLKEN